MSELEILVRAIIYAVGRLTLGLFTFAVAGAFIIGFWELGKRVANLILGYSSATGGEED